MKLGQIVHIKVKMQPLDVGDRGVIENILTNGSQHPIMVKWDKLQHVLPMKWDELLQK